MLLDFENFVERTTFVSESSERKLESGSNLKYYPAVNAKGTNGEDEFIAFALMLESSYEDLLDLMKIQDGDAVIDTGDLRESSIPSLIVSNNRERGIISVSSEEFDSIAPGDKCEVEVSLTDDEGVRYLNGRNVSRVEPEEGEEANVSFSLEEAGASAQ